MGLMHTPICDFGWEAPDFNLTGVDGQSYNLDNIRGENGTLVMFICNHCPYVKTIIHRLVSDMKELQSNGIGVIAIMSNDTINYPDDSFENMKIFSKNHNFSFPYVIDETQSIAKAYGATCTPDFFGFNKDLELQYRGRLDEVNPSNPGNPGTKHELLEAMLEIARSGQGPQEQTPSMGCSIKWQEMFQSISML